MINFFGIKKIILYYLNSVYICSCLLCIFIGECYFYKKNVLLMLLIIFKLIILVLNVFFIKRFLLCYIFFEFCYCMNINLLGWVLSVFFIF